MEEKRVGLIKSHYHTLLDYRDQPDRMYWRRFITTTQLGPYATLPVHEEDLSIDVYYTSMDLRSNQSHKASSFSSGTQILCNLQQDTIFEYEFLYQK